MRNACRTLYNTVSGTGTTSGTLSGPTLSGPGEDSGLPSSTGGGGGGGGRGGREGRGEGGVRRGGRDGPISVYNYTIVEALASQSMAL